MHDLPPLDRIPRVFRHLLFWVIYLALQSLWWTGPNHDQPGWTGLLPALPLKIAVVYFNICFLIPRFLYRKRTYAYIAGLSGTLLITALAQSVIDTQWLRSWYEAHGSQGAAAVITFGLVFRYAAFLSYDVFITGSLKLIRAFYQQRQRSQELASKQLRTELDLLKYQINPHFFFNTLNSLYGMSLRRDDRTPDMILKLSDMMHFVLYEASPTRIPVSREIKVIRDYIELERIRRDEEVSVTFHEICEYDHALPPLLLLPLVENAFKHGRPSDEGIFFINILLTSDAGQVELIVENCVNEKPGASSGGGIGLNNLRRRLELIYPGRFELTVHGPRHQLFMVKLKIYMH